MRSKFDFSGWATRNDLKCSDGRVIRKDAFKHNDGMKVPLVWNHQHNAPENVVGHALLENRDEGVYAYCSLNDTKRGKGCREMIKHGDITALSIYANRLKQKGSDVYHGEIREVSLVLAGANPGAFIERVLCHDDEDGEVGIIYTGEEIELAHSEEAEESNEELEHAEEKEEPKEEPKKEENKVAAEKTVQEVWDTLNEEQKNVVYAIIGKAVEDAKGGSEENMKHNVFDEYDDGFDVLSHAEIQEIFDDARRYGSLKDQVLAHTQDYGIENIDYLFPDFQNPNGPEPDFYKRADEWVEKFMSNVHRTPFSRIKSLFANITENDARAKGYIKGHEKTEEVFALLKRETVPTTIYKKQKLDRDDVIDITDFDVVAWLKKEMRMMLDEEIARAALIGDGRSVDSDDKINPLNIRPIWTDNDFYSIKATVELTNADTDETAAKKFIKAAKRARKDYKGSGNCIAFMSEDMLTSCLLIEDLNGRVIYDSVEKLATALRVKSIVTVPLMENLTRTVETVTRSLMAIIVDLKDYNIGADKGGAVNMFDDFDIDFNQQKYLIETRCSGALVKPKSAIVLESVVGE